MSNTPLTQLVQLHRLYWLKVKGLTDNVPKLEIGIVNVHPVKQDTIPWDHDGVTNRNNDITFSDRTQREQEALLLVSVHYKDHEAKGNSMESVRSSHAQILLYSRA